MTRNVSRSDDRTAVETDERNYARVKEDETCKRVLLPRSNPGTQLDWRVCLAAGARYAPPEERGVYAKEVDCKHGVQSTAQVFGRDTVSIAAGGRPQDLASGERATLGTRILGSVLSEGSVHITTPAERGDGFEQRPVTVFGDVVGGHVTVEQPLVVFGNLVAAQSLRVDAPTVVLGDTRADGTLDASRLCTLSVGAQEDITLGERVLVVNPLVRSVAGSIELTESVGLLDSLTVDRLGSALGTDSVPLGAWLFAEPAAWEPGSLTEADVRAHGDGTVASRAWRTVTEPTGEYEFLRSSVAAQGAALRADPPSVDERPPSDPDPRDGEPTWTGVSVTADDSHYRRADVESATELPSVGDSGE